MDDPKEPQKKHAELKPDDLAKSASNEAAHSVLADVYNWGANKVSSAASWAYDHPGEAAATAAITAGAALLATKRLPLLAISAGAAAIGLAGCDQAPSDTSGNSQSDSSNNTSAAAAPEEKTPARVYENPAQCAADGVFTQNYCNDKFAEAQKEHLAIAPKFESKEACEDETGTACAAAPTDTTNPANGAATKDNAVGPAASANGDNHSTSTGHSFFMPYMFGYMMGSNNSTSRDYVARPLYGTPGSSIGNRSFLTPEGHPLGSRTGSVSVPHSSISEGHAGSSNASRGGFGSTGRGSFGGARGGGFAG